MKSNIHHLGFSDGRKETWNFPDGTIVTMEVPKEEPPITVKHAIYCFSECIHRTHEAMK